MQGKKISFCSCLTEIILFLIFEHFELDNSTSYNNDQSNDKDGEEDRSRHGTLFKEEQMTCFNSISKHCKPHLEEIQVFWPLTRCGIED